MIDIENLADEIANAVKDYTDDVSEGIEKEALKTANEARDELRQTSPERTGDYAKGWSRRKTGRGNVAGHTVYNKNKPSLTHLLEFGHADRAGGRVEGQPHIQLVEEKYSDMFEKRVEEIIKKGGK